MLQLLINKILDFAETDPNCKRFLERVFPEVYKKVDLNVNL